MDYGWSLTQLLVIPLVGTECGRGYIHAIRCGKGSVEFYNRGQVASTISTTWSRGWIDQKVQEKEKTMTHYMELVAVLLHILLVGEWWVASLLPKPLTNFCIAVIADWDKLLHFGYKITKSANFVWISNDNQARPTFVFVLLFLVKFLIVVNCLCGF